MSNLAHLHEVIDHDNHFIIDPITRKIEPETPTKNELVQFDHNSERYTFEIPRYVDGHDMSLCSTVQIHYINVSADKQQTNMDVYEVEDLGVMADKDDTVAFTWLISQNATQLVGTLNFAIRFICTTGDPVDYVWNTKVHSGVGISDGLNNSATVIEDYTDVLEQWRQTLFSERPVLTTLTLPVSGWVPSSDTTYYTQIVSVPNITANTKIELQPTPEQLVEMILDGLTMFSVNDNLSVKIYCVGDLPTQDITIQASMREVRT